MATWKLFSWKSLSIFVTIVFVPFTISLIANYTTWFGTKERIEITCKLDGWITIGTLLETDLEGLELTYKGESVKNAMKVSWIIINTGSKGISGFEKPPSIVYPGQLNVVKATVSDKSPLLNVDKELSIDPEQRAIRVSNIGIFNANDFLKIDLYIIDIPDSRISIDYFNNWSFVAKSLDLELKVDTAFQLQREEIPDRETEYFREFPFFVIIGIAFTALAGTLFLVFSILFQGKKLKLTLPPDAERDLKCYSNSLHVPILFTNHLSKPAAVRYMSCVIRTNHDKIRCVPIKGQVLNQIVGESDKISLPFFDNNSLMLKIEPYDSISTRIVFIPDAQLPIGPGKAYIRCRFLPSGETSKLTLQINILADENDVEP